MQFTTTDPVSYTHLDVYKRQVYEYSYEKNTKNKQLNICCFVKAKKNVYQASVYTYILITLNTLRNFQTSLLNNVSCFCVNSVKLHSSVRFRI